MFTAALELMLLGFLVGGGGGARQVVVVDVVVFSPFSADFTN